MSNKAIDNGEADLAHNEAPGFMRRYRLPLFLAAVAVCLYAGSILYILYGKGQLS
ncbi:MAG: hypothetical protein KTR32_07635 [Granulosicoccus sp.]|nr:hypothetical protein [Granulosicoccus sp.]